jgi:phosphate-selective porin OprO/OprP
MYARAVKFRFLLYLALFKASCLGVLFVLASLGSAIADETVNKAEMDCPVSNNEQAGDKGAESLCQDAENKTGSTAKTNRNDASDAIAANVQDATLLWQLLEGRHLIFVGRLEGDYARYQISALEGENGFEIRRFRLGLAGISPWAHWFSYKVEADFSNGSANLADAYVHAELRTHGGLTAGNQDVTQNLSAMTGSLSQIFMENPLPVNAFSLTKRLALAYDLYGKNLGIHTMIFGKDINNPDAGDYGWAGRAYFNPHRSEKGIWHLGGAFVTEKVSSTARFYSRPESHLTDILLLDTGRFSDVNKLHNLSASLAGATGSFSTRMELFASHWKRNDVAGNWFYGAYLEGGYFITGQAYRYVHGQFVRPRLTDQATAWEIGYRLSWANLNDKDVRGGEERNIGLALNYYPRPNLRGMFNLIYVSSDTKGGDGWLGQARLQYHW